MTSANGDEGHLIDCLIPPWKVARNGPTPLKLSGQASHMTRAILSGILIERSGRRASGDFSDLSFERYIRSNPGGTFQGGGIECDTPFKIIIDMLLLISSLTR